MQKRKTDANLRNKRRRRPILSYLINDGMILVIEFAGGLPDETCYKIDLFGSILGLTGDANCMVRGLVGNTNCDNFTNLIDMAQVKSRNVLPIAGANVKMDVNFDGNINLIDMAAVKGKNGGSAVCP